MKTLRKISFENFERLTVVEASQLYGGTGDNPPTTPMPTDSIPTNKNDSIPSTPIPKKTPKHEISVGVGLEPNGSGTVKGKYKVSTSGGTSFTVDGAYNTKNGWSVTGTIGISLGGKKK